MPSYIVSEQETENLSVEEDALFREFQAYMRAIAKGLEAPVEKRLAENKESMEKQSTAFQKLLVNHLAENKESMANQSNEMKKQLQQLSAQFANLNKTLIGMAAVTWILIISASFVVYLLLSQAPVK